MPNRTHPEEIRICPAGREALPAIAALAEVIWRAHYPGIISPAQIEYMLGRMYALDVLTGELESGISWDQLLVRETLAGFASYGPVRRRQCKLHKLYLHPQWQRQGLGTLLLQHVARTAREYGATTLVLTVNKRNTNAVGAYRKNGFEVRESVVTDIGGGFVMDDYVMARSL